MIRRTIRLLWRGAVVGFLAYAFFFARLGERTPFQHVMRIAATSEAQELGHEVGVATERITKHIGDQVFEATLPSEPEVAANTEVPSDVVGAIEQAPAYDDPQVEVALEQHVR